MKKNKNTFKDYLVVAKVIGTLALIPLSMFMVLYCFAYGITLETFI
jgi:hypothetical protein